MVRFDELSLDVFVISIPEAIILLLTLTHNFRYLALENDLFRHHTKFCK
jgi:hypothetical protein